MATKTKGSLVGTLFLVAVVAVAASMLGDEWGGKTPVRNDTQEYVEVTVRFTPSPNVYGIHIIFAVETVTAVEHVADRSPWKHGQWVPKGAQVSVMAQQTTADMVMCTLTSNGVVVDTSVRKNELGSARCWHNRRITLPQP
jgi:hypothetical protein